VSVQEIGVNVAVASRHAERITFCLFDERGEKETARFLLPREEGDVFCGFIAGLTPGARYGLRADGPYDPDHGHWFDPAKLLVDPYARALDRPFRLKPELAAPRAAGIDTAEFVPKAIVTPDRHVGRDSRSSRPRFIYEVSVRAFTRTHPGVPQRFRGTVAALARPAVLDHLTRIGVDTVELMPLAATIDERHLVPLGLANGWGYNPVVFMAPDPRLAPGGMEEVAATVAALQRAGIKVIVDAVFNHTGESDRAGPTLSLRGLDNALYYRHDGNDPGRLVNDTGTGNMLAAEREPVVRLVVDAMRHWAAHTGIDGFRLDLATVLGRTLDGFSSEAPLIRAIRADPLLGDLIVIAEPWDIGPNGYQLGSFPTGWQEWNDRFRDDVRRFWRGDRDAIGALATRLAGSSDIFRRRGRSPSASVNFVAAHDGFTLRDLVSYAEKHNVANGEHNRDGRDENFSWNSGIEGETSEPAIVAMRRRDIRALIATLFVARGTPMLTAGDEIGRTQQGNNNAYAQDNAITWLDWQNADSELAAFVGRLARLRRDRPALSTDDFFDGTSPDGSGIPDVAWLHPEGREMETKDWEAGSNVLGAALYRAATAEVDSDRVVVWINAGSRGAAGWLPDAREGWQWLRLVDSARPDDEARTALPDALVNLAPRSVVILAERRGGRDQF
jgi:glycogen operon protein